MGLVDTGVEPNNDIARNLLLGADYSDGPDRSIGDGRTDTDAYGHGTGEAALIAGSDTDASGGTVGLAPTASIMPLRASDGSSAQWVFGVGPAIRFAIAHGCRIINLAFAVNLDVRELREAVSDALHHDIVVVAAVGNDGTSQQYFPAAWPGVVGVGAIDSSGKVWDRSNTGADVALVAPG
ncbi:MAG TPA: S8 family serine peptidase, partial [Bryobacteraceae bacterium]